MDLQHSMTATSVGNKRTQNIKESTGIPGGPRRYKTALQRTP
jgi:hypothetical protein